MSKAGPIRVVGVGSPQGDDAVGWAVIRRLRDRLGDRPDIELSEAAGGQDLLGVLDGRGSLHLIDAMTSGAAPGTIHEFGWPDARLAACRPGSTHQLGPAAALELAAILGLVPPQVVVFGVEIGSTSPGTDLSPIVLAAARSLTERLTDRLRLTGTSG